MTYVCDIGNGQRLLVENDGDDTQVALSSGDSGQQQNQSTGFDTGTLLFLGFAFYRLYLAAPVCRRPNRTAGIREV